MHDIDKLNSLNIIEVAKKLGINLNSSHKSICFSHSETKPSLQFYLKTNSYHCYGCGIGGKVIDLVKNYYSLDFISACNWLENEFNITYHPEIKRKSLKKPIQKSVAVKDSIGRLGNSQLNQWVIDYLQLDKKAIDYLENKRKISIETANKYFIKSVSDINLFYEKLNKEFALEILIDGGYYKITAEGEVKPVWWTSGIIIPYFNRDNNIQTLQMRCYDDTYAKYVFLSKVEKCIFNENILDEIKSSEKVIICEGAFDALCLCERDYNAVAIPGANSMKESWYNLFERFFNIILFDNDEAGKTNSTIIMSKMLSKGINAIVFNLGKYNDLNEMIISEGNKL